MRATRLLGLAEQHLRSLFLPEQPVLQAAFAPLAMRLEFLCITMPASAEACALLRTLADTSFAATLTELELRGSAHATGGTTAAAVKPEPLTVSLTLPQLRTLKYWDTRSRCSVAVRAPQLR